MTKNTPTSAAPEPVDERVKWEAYAKDAIRVLETIVDEGRSHPLYPELAEPLLYKIKQLEEAERERDKRKKAANELLGECQTKNCEIIELKERLDSLERVRKAAEKICCRTNLSNSERRELHDELTRHASKHPEGFGSADSKTEEQE